MPPPSPGPLPDPGQLTSQHVRRAVDGDAASMSWLIERLNPLLIAQARWRMGAALSRVCEPADLVHEAWLVLLPRLDTLPPRDGRMTPVLLSFLSTTILHKTQNLLRREARRRLQTGSAGDGEDPLLELGGPQSEVVSAVVRREAETQIREALEELNEQDREILLMRGIEQQETEAVMELLGLSRDAVYKRYARALTRLRERFPNSVFDELRDE
ncbi:MAG: sigma-70 family RNA polymerase sigma factor [bacterium]|nr:sigma-70 family RNA polymerase sigma factor [bacterium]